MATVAVFVALGGASYAAVNLPRNSVGGAQIRPNAVTSSDVRNGSLTGGDIRNRSLSPADFSGAVQGPAGPKGDPGVSGRDGANGSPDTPPQVLGKLAQVDGSGSGLDADTLDGQDSAAFAPLPTAVLDGDGASGDLSGTYPGPQIAANAVGADEIATGAVGSSEVLNDSLTAADIDEPNSGLVDAQAETGATGCCQMISTSLNTSLAHNAANAKTFATLGILELRTTATPGEVNVCNLNSTGGNIGFTAYTGGATSSTTESRQRASAAPGACVTVDYNGADTNATGDLRIIVTQDRAVAQGISVGGELTLMIWQF